MRVARSIVLDPSVCSRLGLFVMPGMVAIEMWCILLVMRVQVLLFVGAYCVSRFGLAVGACRVVV